MDFLTRETPDGQTPFLNKITATMPKEEAERFEIALLDNILKHSRYLVESGDKKVLDIVNSGEFLRRASEIKGQFGAKAKDYIDLVSAWHKNFKNDAVLAHLTRNPASEPKVSTGLNPSLDARLKYVATATMFDGFFRLVPRIPFITDKFIGNDKIQAAALRYYLKKTLNESPSISALRRKLNFDLDKGNLPLNSQTRERLRQITNEVQQSEAQMDELAENLMKNSDENANLIQNLENSAQFGRDMFILGEENLNGDIVKWALQNNKRIAVNKLNAQKAQELGFKHPDDVRRTIGADEIRHTLSRHGENSELVKKSGQPPVNENDIANYQKISDNADETLKSLDNSGNLVEVSFKQVNGYFVVVEQVRNKNNEFSFKTMFKDNGIYKNSEAYTKTAEKAQTLSQGYEPSANSFAQSADEIIPNSSSQSQAPQKSLLEQARENTERLRAAQEAEQIAQKEAELARLKEMQAKNAEILAQKEAAANKAINEVQNLQIGTPIKAQKISDTKIIINDNTAPFKAEFIIAKKDDIKPNFERTGTQGRSQRQDKVIESIQSDFKPHLIFEQTGGFEGLPIILKDGQVIAGNHRAQAIKGLTGENLTRYKQAAKEKFGIDLKDDEVIVRLVKDGDEKELINLAFMSNVGRESNLGEKALANLAKYESNMQNLPSHINADSVFELESQVAKALDTQGNGLNVFDTNLALLSKIAKNSSNTDILESLNTLKSLSQDEKEKVLRMFVSNAGEFHNLAKDTELKSLNLNDYLADALIIAAKNVDEKTRKANFQSLFSDIQTMLASAKEQLKIDPFLFENFKSKALGYALARFARLENPAGKLFDFLKASKGEMENLYTGGLFDTNKAISDIDIYDFLKHAINSGDDLMDNGVNLKHAITSKLDDLRKVENALIDSGEIQFAKSKAKPKTIKFIDNFTQNSALFKTLDNEKQQAILKIKEIEAEKMPDNLMNLGDFENLQVHFSGKADEAQRQKYAPLFDITTQKPDIKLKTSKDGQERTEYIKAFQHKESKDMFYIAITQENDKIKITGIPTTQISKVVNDIIKSEKVLKAGNFETISNPAELNKVSTLNDIIPKIANKFNKDEIWAKNLYEWHKDSSPLTKNDDGTPKVFYHGSNTPDITIFGNDYSGIGFWFSDDKQYANYFKSQIGGKTYEVFLNTKNPLDLSKDIDLKELKQIFGDEIEKFAGVSEETLKELKNPAKIFMPHNQSYADDAFKYAQKIQDAGYDGIIGKDNANNPYFVVFNPNQIKSIDNTGKFDSTNDNILFALGKAKPQGREAKETNINSLFADDELQMQATKPTKELNLSDEKDFNELGEFFKLNLKDKEFNALYDKAAATAQRLSVKVRFDESAGRSHFVLNDNTITIAAGNKELFQAQDLLHELIHATTRKALKDFSQSPEQAAKIYTKRQIEAINEINSLYLKSKGIAKRQGKDAYALQNVDEFVAELSSSEFRAFLKAQDIFERFIKALIRFFTGDSEKLAKNVNSYKALKESYYKILDDYEPPRAPKSQSQLEFEKAQRQIGELKAQKAELLSQMRPPVTQAVRDEIKEKAKKLNKEIERTFLKAKLTQKIGKENLTSQRLEQARKNNERIIVDKLDSQEAQKLGFDEPEFVARSIDGDAINHTLNRHGEGSELVKNGQPAVTLDDIAKYPQIADTADEVLKGVSDKNLPTRITFKQVNGYFVVVEEVHNGQGELAFKTMFKENGNYKNSNVYKQAQQETSIGSNSHIAERTKARRVVNVADKEIIPNSKGQSQAENSRSLKEKLNDEVWAEHIKELNMPIDNKTMEVIKIEYHKGIVADEVLLNREIQNKLKSFDRRGDIKGKEKFLNEEIKDFGKDYFYYNLNFRRQKIERELNINPLKEFGTNYAEFYRDGQGAVKKLLAEKQGQVAGAFYRQELGDIDLVWGNDEIGLKKIIDKHLSDFADFKGDTAQDKLANALGEIVKDGKVHFANNIPTIYHKKGDEWYLVGLSKGFNGTGDNLWVITSYKKTTGKIPDEILSGDTLNLSAYKGEFNPPLTSGDEPLNNKIIPNSSSQSQGKVNSMLESKKAYDSELKRLNNELEYTETLLGKINERGMIDKLNDLRDEILAQKRELLKQDPFKFEKVSHEVSHINQNNDIMPEISHKGGQDGTSNASNGLNATEKGMPASEPAGISDGLFSQKQLLDEPRGAGADFSNSPTHRQQPQTLFSQGASEPNASGGQQRGSNERLRTASGDLRGEVSGDGQNLQAQQGHNVSERFGQDRSEQHSRAKHTIRANSSSGASHSNATTTQELVSDTNAAGILSPAEKATIENQTFTQTIDPAKFNANEILSANILTKNYDKEHLNELIDAGNDIVRLAQLAKNGNKTAERILQNYHTEAVGRGYSGYSMSVNAVEAQENGVKPLSKFNAKDAQEVSEILNEKISTKELKNLLSDFGDTGEWHHTSKFYNKTPHYSVAEMFLSLDKVKKRLALKNTKKDIIEANTQLYNDYISQINKAAEFVKNAKDIDKSWVLSWFRERKMNAKNYLERENKFGTKAEFDVINEVFKVKTLENHPQFNALFIQQNKENLQNLAKISSGNLEKGQDLDLKNKTLQEIMLKNEKIINYAFLKQIADDLPPALSKDEFIKALAPNAKGRANIKTPIKDIEINAEQAWEHLLDNSKGEDRTKISGGLLQTLKKPFFVTKNNEGSYYFYKPFKDERGILNLISIEVPKAARLKYKTSYIADKNKMLELITKHELVYKSW